MKKENQLLSDVFTFFHFIYVFLCVYLQLPLEMQSKVTSYMRLDSNSHSDSEGSTTGMPHKSAMQNDYHIVPASDESPPPICPFPPTAMVYSMRGLGKC